MLHIIINSFGNFIVAYLDMFEIYENFEEPARSFFL